MAGILDFLGRNAGIIGAGASFIPGVGPGVGMALGALGGAIQTSTNNPSTAASANDPLYGTALMDLIQTQQNRNTTQELYNALSPSMVGAGDIASSNAVRGAGRNSFGTLLLQGLRQSQMQVGSQIQSGLTAMNDQQQSALAQLVGMQIGGNQNRIQNQFGAQVEGNNRRDSFLNALLSIAATRYGRSDYGNTSGG